MFTLLLCCLLEEFATVWIWLFRDSTKLWVRDSGFEGVGSQMVRALFCFGFGLASCSTQLLFRVMLCMAFDIAHSNNWVGLKVKLDWAISGLVGLGLGLLMTAKDD